jgi:acyl CoA:acetate/3-ketoacid CoA transferase
VNFGFGIPGGIPALAQRAGVTYWGTVEQGIHTGALFDGPMFGAARDADAILSSVDQFDFYSGGGIDIAFLGMGEMDGAGNVNVSKMGGVVIGPGGFVDITQTARKVVFCGAFEAKGLTVAERDGRVDILATGAVPKLVAEVAHITFSGPQARRNGQDVLYVTERAVFRLGAEGVELIEVAPGIDPERDVLARMGFAPRMALAA